MRQSQMTRWHCTEYSINSSVTSIYIKNKDVHFLCISWRIRLVYNLAKQFWSGINCDYFTISMHNCICLKDDSRPPVPGLCPFLPFASCCGLFPELVCFLLTHGSLSFSFWTITVGLPYPAIVLELQLTQCIRKNNLSSKQNTNMVQIATTLL